MTKIIHQVLGKFIESDEPPNIINFNWYIFRSRLQDDLGVNNRIIFEQLHQWYAIIPLIWLRNLAIHLPDDFLCVARSRLIIL